ncbi:16043_t:CDS:2, partial [Acaulospora colombiana]
MWAVESPAVTTFWRGVAAGVPFCQPPLLVLGWGWSRIKDVSDLLALTIDQPEANLDGLAHNGLPAIPLSFSSRDSPPSVQPSRVAPAPSQHNLASVPSNPENMSTSALLVESTDKELVYDGREFRSYIQRGNTLFTEKIVQGHSLTNNFFTFSFWLKLNTTSSPLDEVLVIHEHSISSSIRVRMDPSYESLEDGRLRIELWVKGKPKSTDLLPFTKIRKTWTHVVIVRSEDHWTVYLNGIENRIENRLTISDYLPTTSEPPLALTLQIAFN